MNRDEQFVRIRRFLRDPSARIWSDDLLERIYNDIQEEIQVKTKILEEVEAIKVPPMYHFSYMHDWEYVFLPSIYSRFYRCLTQHQQADHVQCHVWEMQEVWQITSDVADIGSHFTHPFESVYATPADEVKIRFPQGFHDMRFIAFDKDPIGFAQKKDIQKNSSWQTQSGTPFSYYRPSELDDDFVLYPRSSKTPNWTEGEGLALFDSDDTTDSEIGVVTRNTGNTLSKDSGLTIDFINLTDNVFMVFGKNPTDLTAGAQESDFPTYMRKYIEYGVLARAFKTNGDGRIESLSKYWEKRFELGIKAIKRYKIKRKSDRNYRLGGHKVIRRTQHPRLPSEYPYVSHIQR